MMKKLHLNIVSPEKELFNGEVESVLINQKLRKKKDESYCSIKNYFISLQRNQRRSIIKQLELW